MNIPKILSVIIPTRNAGHHIGHLLESLVAARLSAQSVGYDLQIIVQDCCSVDDTAALVRPYLGVDDLLIIESDRGIYDAMNRALKLAKGDWVIFMGADDTLLMFTLCSELSDLAQSVKVVVGDSL